MCAFIWRSASTARRFLFGIPNLGRPDQRESGAGRTPHAIAAGLNGSLGLAMAGGEIENALVASLFGDVLHSAGLSGELAGNLARSRINCFALRLTATHGVAHVDPLVLDRPALPGGFIL